MTQLLDEMKLMPAMMKIRTMAILTATMIELTLADSSMPMTRRMSPKQ